MLRYQLLLHPLDDHLGTMAKFTIKTTTYSTTNIMLLLSLNPVIITKKNRIKIKADLIDFYEKISETLSV